MALTWPALSSRYQADPWAAIITSLLAALDSSTPGLPWSLAFERLHSGVPLEISITAPGRGAFYPPPVVLP